MNGNKEDATAESSSIHSTSDNQYFDREVSTSGAPKSYTPDEAGEWLRKSGRWVRQKANDLKIGQKHKKLWTFSTEDLTMLKLAIRRSKKEDVVMRDVSPRTPEAAEAIRSTVDDLHYYLAAELKKLKGEFFDLASDILRAAHNEHVKDFNRHEKQIYDNWAELKELRDRIRELEGKKSCGRGALRFAVAAPLPLPYAAEAA